MVLVGRGASWLVTRSIYLQEFESGYSYVLYSVRLLADNFYFIYMGFFIGTDLVQSVHKLVKISSIAIHFHNNIRDH